MGYGSDYSVHGEEGIVSNPPMTDARPHSAPNQFAKRGEANAPLAKHRYTYSRETIITNSLDEHQQLIIHQEESALRRSPADRILKSHFGYVLTTPDVKERLRKTIGRTLSTWTLGSEASSP